MDGESWIKHIDQWERFLRLQISSAEDEGMKTKAFRQLKSIEMVRYSAVLNPAVLTSFISPPPTIHTDYHVPNFYLSLNDSQKRAVEAALDENCITLIQGPPGTGKTQVITEICLQMYKRNPNVRILVCSETHVAVNNLISRIASIDPSIRILRIRDKEQDELIDEYSPKTIIENYIKWIGATYSSRDLLSIFSEALSDTENPTLEKALALSSNIVGMTCNRVGAYDFESTSEMFDMVIIDEVCKATLPEILMPLAIAQKAVLVGDPKQLPPVFCSEEIDIIKKIEECKLQKYMYIDELFSGGNNVCTLDTQYRMADEIGNLISELFYDNVLQNGRNAVIKDSIQWVDYEPEMPWPVYHEEDGEKQKIYNLDECSIVSQILLQLDSQPESNISSVAVISPYKAQVFKIRECVRKMQLRQLKVDVDTVDGFQGKECDCVLFSLARTTGTFRFLADQRRLNVALSRARDYIIIVGNVEYASHSALLSRIIKKSKVINNFGRMTHGQ